MNRIAYILSLIGLAFSLQAQAAQVCTLHLSERSGGAVDMKIGGQQYMRYLGGSAIESASRDLGKFLSIGACQLPARQILPKCEIRIEGYNGFTVYQGNVAGLGTNDGGQAASFMSKLLATKAACTK